MNELERLLDFLKERSIPVKEDGFASIPKEHCFAVWSNTESAADGADDFSLFWDHTIVFRFNFKERRTAEDRRLEKEAEGILRDCGRFSRKRQYDSDMEADTTTYTFEVTTDFEEDL